MKWNSASSLLRATTAVVLISALTGCRDVGHPSAPLVEPGPEIIPASELSAVRLVFANDAGLFAIDGDGTDLVELDDGEFNNVSASRDGKLLAFDRGGNVYVIGADGSGLRQITSVAGTHPAWSPDGSKIVFSGHGRSLYVADVASGERIRLTDTRDEALDYAPHWSPDGSQIVFTRQLDDDFFFDFPRTFVVRSDGAGEIQVPTMLSSEFAMWSPDGKRLAFTAIGRSVMLIKPDGTAPVYINTRLNLYSELNDWSRDGSFLLVTMRPTIMFGNSDIYLIDERGRSARITTEQATSAAFLSR